MPESAKEIDLDPRKYVGLSFPLRADSNNDFALTKTSTQQAVHNLKNLLLTFPGERLGQPEFGSRLRELCFEQQITRAVLTWLPHINLQKIDTLTDETSKNTIFVSIAFSTSLDSSSTQSLTIDVGSVNG